MAITEGWAGDRDVNIYEVRDAESGLQSRKVCEDIPRLGIHDFHLYTLVLVENKLDFRRFIHLFIYISCYSNLHEFLRQLFQFYFSFPSDKHDGSIIRL